MKAKFARERSKRFENGDFSSIGVIGMLKEVVRGKIAEACIVGKKEAIDPLPTKTWSPYCDEIKALYVELREDGYEIRFEKVDSYKSVAIISW